MDSDGTIPIVLDEKTHPQAALEADLENQWKSLAREWKQRNTRQQHLHLVSSNAGMERWGRPIFANPIFSHPYD